MTFETLNNRNTTNNFGEVILYANDITNGILINGILISFFIIAFLGSYLSMNRIRGRGDIVASFATAGFITFGLAIILSLQEGLMSIQSILVYLTLSIIGFIWLIFSKSR